MYRFTWYLYQNVGEEEEYLPIMNLGGFGLLNRIISGLYGLRPYIHDFLLENTSQEDGPCELVGSDAPENIQNEE